MLASGKVNVLALIGSSKVADHLKKQHPKSHRLRAILGLDAKNAAIILADADIELTVKECLLGTLSFNGQRCTALKMLIVHRSIADDVERELTAAVQTLVVGDPLDEATDVSALISTGERDRVASWVTEAREQGARVSAGGAIGDDGVLAPTLVLDATPDMKVCSQEVFGPVVAVTRYDDFDDALRMANDTRYGLQAGVFTADITKALRAARTLDFGGVLINEVPTWRADQQPYGGLRDSGNTREGPAWSVREMTEERLIILTG